MPVLNNQLIAKLCHVGHNGLGKDLMKQLKPVKKIPFLIVSPFLSIIGEVIFIFVLLSLMDTLVFGKRNMASLLMSMVVGAALWAVYGLVEYFMRRRREMKWYLFGVGAYLVPMICWGILALVSYTVWYSNRLSENAEFFMYLTRTMLLYLSWAAAFRFGGHLIFYIAGGGLDKSKNNKKKRGE